ncbi:zinc ribbon domain-containing protein [Trichothermofontia sp.]
MLGWAHYRFAQCLEYTYRLTGSTLIRGSEAYTSKTCAQCGHIQPNLGGARVFRCQSCGSVLPRDFKGALGFMLKALRDAAFAISNDGIAIAALSGEYPYVA